jgi:hypothetical protein
MKFLRTAVVLMVMAIGAVVGLQRTGVAQAATNLRVTAPENGHKFRANIVGVRFSTQLEAAASSQPEPAPADRNSLPEAGGALPLLSVIGFGVLLGGIASALKTR